MTAIRKSSARDWLAVMCKVNLREAHVLLFEPASTLNTGDVVSERTVRDPERS